ncbi:MAG: hypothetical protein A2Y25_00560 [Candidatus Melainabacteria bacterium GWF2_37_15]|nr:MAG: hypothetical protein A2Y25_00560 [Candidatus Melainabacteria bacterium GWF2_37_15]
MQISGNYNPYTQPLYRKQPTRVSFGTTVPRISVINPETESELNPQTKLFRDDINWNFLTKTIKKHFPEGTKIYCYAGSDGSEAYSLAMKLIDKFGDIEAEKFSIESIDLNKENIDLANSGLLGIDETGRWPDRHSFNDNIKHKRFEDYFTEDDTRKPVKYDCEDNPMTISYYKVAKELTEKIEFKQGNILKDTKKEFEKPCVVMFRNAWYTLGDSNIEKLADNLSSNLKKGSLVVIGETENHHRDSELSHRVDILLENKGFKPIKQLFRKSYIFEKQ